MFVVVVAALWRCWKCFLTLLCFLLHIWTCLCTFMLHDIFCLGYFSCRTISKQFIEQHKRHQRLVQGIFYWLCWPFRLLFIIYCVCVVQYVCVVQWIDLLPFYLLIQTALNAYKRPERKYLLTFSYVAHYVYFLLNTCCTMVFTIYLYSFLGLILCSNWFPLLKI